MTPGDPMTDRPEQRAALTAEEAARKVVDGKWFSLNDYYAPIVAQALIAATEECERLTKVKDDSVWAEIRAHDRRAVAEAKTVDLKSEVARLRAALEDMVALDDCEAHFEDAYERALPAARAALNPQTGEL